MALLPWPHPACAGSYGKGAIMFSTFIYRFAEAFSKEEYCHCGHRPATFLSETLK
jgi:hypothetical protein